MKLVLSVFLLATLVEAYQVGIEPGDAACFHMNFQTDDYVKVQYEVHAGGYLDINFNLTSPSNELLHTTLNTSAHFMFRSSHVGNYKICFDNSYGVSQQIKEISFFFDIDQTKTMEKVQHHHGSNTSDHERLVSMVHNLKEQLYEVNSETYFLQMRQKWHSVIVYKTNFSVVAFGVFQCIFMAVGGWLQVYYTQKFFEVRLCV
ncbi:unnamed protein product [Bursaphelenchus okinawaensis]|uniref:GOLD domain-containing protein n=1 Tax=Bursaphelenchus okinawaensis TaxID=465554 RepID=A0A811KAP5_9BILA|nr:unnamed protein product [Bursaphelenchus okinawaensis]CAG9096609.1 unnamed protein product [Bursaphelenchus okinawaensis]